MSNVPFFSIIVPVYNVEHYLGECIDSVISQTYEDYEIILIDDGSTDNSGSICDLYKKRFDNKIKVIHKKNGGLSKARNTGIFYAQGIYIIFLDSDDYFLDKNALSKIRDKAENQDLIAFEWKEIPDNLKDSDIATFYPKYPLEKIFDGREFLEKSLSAYPGMPWYAWRFVYRRQYIQEYKLLFKEGRLYEDVLFTPKAVLLAKSVSILAYPVYGYRVGRSGSITSTVKYKNLYDHLYASVYNVKLVNSMSGLTDNLRTRLLSNFAEGYFSVMINVYALPTKEERIKIIEQLRMHRNIAQYANGKKQVIARAIMNTFGIMPAIWLLNMRRVIKRMLK